MVDVNLLGCDVHLCLWEVNAAKVNFRKESGRLVLVRFLFWLFQQYCLPCQPEWLPLRVARIMSGKYPQDQGRSRDNGMSLTQAIRARVLLGRAQVGRPNVNRVLLELGKFDRHHFRPPHGRGEVHTATFSPLYSSTLSSNRIVGTFIYKGIPIPGKQDALNSISGSRERNSPPPASPTRQTFVRSLVFLTNANTNSYQR